MNSSSLPPFPISRIKNDFSITDSDNNIWQISSGIAVDTYWSGEKAPAGRHFETRFLWSETGLYVRFQAQQAEPLIVNEKPDLTKKTMGLWERDVCEIFIAPNGRQRNKYFEFEIAPTGEWIDLGISMNETQRIIDWEYDSGLEASVRIEEEMITIAAKIPWKAFGTMPKLGDVWMGNLFRCVGRGSARGYLAFWQDRPLACAQACRHAFAGRAPPPGSWHCRRRCRSP